MRILVTGGAGFIGSNVVSELLRLEHSVVVLDDLSTGNRENIKQLISQKNFEFVQGSILDEKLVAQLIDRVDSCFHFAAALGVSQILERPLESLKTNISGTEIVLEAAFRRGLPTLLASTSEIYGKNTLMPLNEESDRVLGSPDKTRWSYSEAKAIDETIAFVLHRKSDWDVKILRFFNTVGPGQNSTYGMVIPNFCKSAIRGEPLTIYGTGQQTRVFCHVADATSAVIKVWQSNALSGKAVNIGGTQEISVAALASMIIEISGSNSKLEFIPYDSLNKVGFEDIERRVPDITRIKTLTNWSPKYSLEQILMECIERARSNER